MDYVIKHFAKGDGLFVTYGAGPSACVWRVPGTWTE